MSFQRSGMIQGRYAFLTQPGNEDLFGSDDEEDDSTQNKKSQEYAAFLKEKERQCGPDGFLDSRRYKHSFTVTKDKKDSRQNGGKGYTSVDLSAKKDKDQKDYERRIKVIEDHMWQHKQEERELKRVEGDIIKNQRAVRRTLRDYENAIARKKLAEEKKLNQSLDKYAGIQRQHVRRREEVTKQQVEKMQNQEQDAKDQGRKVQLVTSDLARLYRTKVGEVELKQGELSNMAKDFEDKLKRKEEEQYRLKQELAELAIALNMEAQKGRVQESDHDKSKRHLGHKRVVDGRQAEVKLENKLAKSDGDMKAAEANKRRLSADLMLNKAHLSLKQREEYRHLQDTRGRLNNNVNEQKQLNDAALHADMDHKSRQIDQKVQAHNFRKRVAAQSVWRERKEKTEQHEQQYTDKFQRRFQEQKRREHEDHLRHFQKEVQKGEEMEHSLYSTVRSAEFSRQKQAQAVRQLQGKLYDVKRQNAVKIKNEMTDLQRQENEIEYKLNKAQADLAKVHAQREEYYIRLQKHRSQLRGDKYLLGEHEREHNRLMRIGQRNEAMATQSY